MKEILLSPPVAIVLFLTIVYGLYRTGEAMAAPGNGHPDRRRPYACGEDLLPTQAQMSYQAFFRLVLRFGILHLAALAISTLPAGAMTQRIATLYLIGAGISAFVLSEEAS